MQRGKGAHVAQLEWVDNRLRNWALWVRGGRTGGLGYAACNVLAAQGGGGGKGSYREAVMPIDGPEAQATDQAISTLQPELQQVVREWYLEPGPAATIAAVIGIGESTLYARLERAQAGVSAWFAERQARQAAERGRIEQLQRGVTSR